MIPRADLLHQREAELDVRELDAGRLDRGVGVDLAVVVRVGVADAGEHVDVVEADAQERDLDRRRAARVGDEHVGALLDRERAVHEDEALELDRRGAGEPQQVAGVVDRDVFLVAVGVGALDDERVAVGAAVGEAQRRASSRARRAGWRRRRPG